MTDGFWLLETEITQELWVTVMETSPDWRLAPDAPMSRISWDDVNSFVSKLNERGYAPEGWTFSLPTEAQWEYACRAGSDEVYGGLSLDEVGWCRLNSDGNVAPVGKRRPNAWGLCDMLGNVSEMCYDSWKRMLPDETDLCFVQEESPSRIVRGGNYGGNIQDCRAAYRVTALRDERSFGQGARLALVRKSAADLARSKPTEPLASGLSGPYFWSHATRGGERNGIVIDDFYYAFRYCPPTGADGFTMGSPEDEVGRDANENEHKVVLSNGFWIQETEVVQRLWTAVMGSEPSKFQGDELPVESIGYGDTQAFIAKLNEAGYAPEGWKFSLPTEAQWEYACRAGGVDAPYGRFVQDEVCWNNDNSEQKTHKVGFKHGNVWGLRDMCGNVGEWCCDSYVETLTDATDPCGDATTDVRVCRGGDWQTDAERCRIAARDGRASDLRTPCVGMRLALVPTSSKPQQAVRVGKVPVNSLRRESPSGQFIIPDRRSLYQ